MLVIGITGGTGTGKTTLLERIKARGGETIDCDAVYYGLLKTDRAMLAQIDAAFPGTVKDGELDRKALGAIVFNDEKALLELNSITHRCVDREIRKILARAEEQGKELAGIDAIALTESGIADRCDVIVGVTAPEKVRAERLIRREGISMEYALMRIRAQKSDSYFAKNCDYIIENGTGDIGHFGKECDRLLKTISGGRSR